jgi:hypothetical protein
MSLNRYDNFLRTMGAEDALAKFNGAFSNEQVEGKNVGHDHSGPGQGGIISGSNILGSVNHSLSCTDAVNLTTSINSKPLSYIFESNGLIVKNATNCTTYINNVPIVNIFESNGLTVRNATTATNSLKLNGLSSNQFVKYYIPSQDILLEKNSAQSIVCENDTFTAATIDIYNQGTYNLSFEIKLEGDLWCRSRFEVSGSSIPTWTGETGSSTYQLMSKDISIVSGRIYIKLTGYNPDPRNFNGTAYIRNIKLKGTVGEVPPFKII